MTYYDIEGKWKEKQWAQLKPGDIVKLKKDEAIPADLLVFGTSVDDLGAVRYDSKSLDGESGLKEAQVPREILNNAVFGSVEKNI